MILYLIQLSTIWTILLIAFYVFYKNQSYHQFNRWYIILSILAGIVIPLIPFDFIRHDVSLLTTGFLYINVLDEITVSAGLDASLSSINYTIAFVFIVYFCLVLYKLNHAINEFASYSNLTRQKQSIAKNVFIQFTDLVEQPFSFFNTIVLPKSLENETRTKEIIIAHELKHIKCRHYNDLVLLKIFEILVTIQ